MLLADHEHRFELRPLRYQFPAVSGDQYDDNWLVVAGEVTTPEGSWSFTDPCLLTDEARQLSLWLRAVGGASSGDSEPDLCFLEPVLSFSHACWRNGSGLARVRLFQEAAPKWLDDDERLDEYVIEIKATAACLRQAADEWDRQLAPVLRPTTKAVDASVLLARTVTPELMRPGWSDALRMSCSVLPHRRLLALDKRLACRRPLHIPQVRPDT